MRATLTRAETALLAATVLVAGLFIAMTATRAEAWTKVTICHATASFTHPYVRITVAADAADGDTGNDNGKGDHSTHTGPVFDGVSKPWGDIIPPHDAYAGLNWSAEGQAVYDNGCVPTTPTPPPTTPPPTTPPPTTPPPTTSTPPPTTPPPTTTPEREGHATAEVQCLAGGNAAVLTVVAFNDTKGDPTSQVDAVVRIGDRSFTIDNIVHGHPVTFTHRLALGENYSVSANYGEGMEVLVQGAAPKSCTGDTGKVVQHKIGTAFTGSSTGPLAALAGLLLLLGLGLSYLGRKRAA